MTIEEAIKQFRYDAENNRADLDMEFAKENEQVAEWLEELKAMRNLDKTNYSDGYQQGRADAERDFQNSDYWNDYLQKIISDAKVNAIEEFINEIDLDKPMHFTKEQAAWIKKYVILKRHDAIDDYTEWLRKKHANFDEDYAEDIKSDYLEQVKEG